VFCEKRLQAIENKAREKQKESQEISRGCKLLTRGHLELEVCERLASDSWNSEADFVEVRQGKELVGLASTSRDIIPSG
jgi:hypothetical protein